MSVSFAIVLVLLELAGLPEQEEGADDEETDDDGGVGDVEVGIVREVDEVRHLAEANTVKEVAGRTAELQPQRKPEQPVLQGREHVVEDNGADGDERRDDEEQLLPLQDAERRSGVGDVSDLHQPIVVRPRLTDREVGPNDGLGNPVERKYANGDTEERQVTPEAIGKGTLCCFPLRTHLTYRHRFDLSRGVHSDRRDQEELGRASNSTPTQSVERHPSPILAEGIAMNTEYFRTLFDYSYWARDRLLKVSLDLSEADYARENGFTYKSIRGILTHCLDAESSWLNRLTGEPVPDVLTAQDLPTIDALARKWRESEESMRSYLDGLTEADLQTDVVWLGRDGQERRLPNRWLTLAHIANHSTQHRSEAAEALTMIGRSPGDLDLGSYAFEKGRDLPA